MIREIKAKSILRKHKRIDSWFLSSYAINLYRGCTHNCVYCDGRNEKYRVEGNFGHDVSIKVNAIDLLNKELDPGRKRKPFDNGFIVICGGVSDSYQPFEKLYNLCRQTLELLCKYNHPVHLLTKSTLVEKDIALLQKINRQKKAIVSFSFSTVDDDIGKLLEPGVPVPTQRLGIIEKFKNAGISCGMYLMPVVPYLTDSSDMIEQSVKKAKNAGIDFVIFGGMTLKKGLQKNYFLDFLEKNFPELLPRFEDIYSYENQWGAPKQEYIGKVENAFCDIANRYGMPKRIPSNLYRSLVTKSELIILMLEQLDYLVKLQGKKSPYGYASYALSSLGKSIEECSYDDLIRMKGIGPFTANIIQEIVKTGKCDYYEKML